MPRSENRANLKKLQQINVKMEDELRARFVEACEIQQHREGQLARILIEWALPFYERARSVEALRKITLPIELEAHVETERDVYQRGRPAKDRKQKDA